MRSKILGLFGNTMTAYQKFPQHFQTLLSEQSEIFSRIFIGILEPTQKCGCFERKVQLHSLNILEIIEPEKCGYFSARKDLF